MIPKWYLRQNFKLKVVQSSFKVEKIEIFHEKCFLRFQITKFFIFPVKRNPVFYIFKYLNGLDFNLILDLFLRFQFKLSANLYIYT
jgi:hypothetical protein